MEGLATARSRFAGITHVFLDLDDTLVVDEAGAWRAFRAAGKLVHQTDGVAVEDAARACRDEARRLWFALKERCPELARTGISSWEALWTPWRGSELPWWGPSVAKEVETYRRQAWVEALRVLGVDDPVLAEDMAREGLAARLSALRPFPEVPRALQNLHAEFALGIVTNGLPTGQRLKLAMAGILTSFPTVVVSAAIGEPKPAADAFLAALEQAGCEARQAVMVGNSLDTDIAGGRGVGMATVWVNRRGASRGDGPKPDAEIRSLAELEVVLGRGPA